MSRGWTSTLPGFFFLLFVVCSAASFFSFFPCTAPPCDSSSCADLISRQKGRDGIREGDRGDGKEDKQSKNRKKAPKSHLMR